MDALILSCSTGGGHNAAGRAAMEALEARGHHARLLDPYELVSPGLGKKVGDTYVGMVQRAPRMFGCVYSLGELYRKLPIHSPVYWVNENMGGVLETYLRENPCDVILMPHVFPKPSSSQRTTPASPSPRRRTATTTSFPRRGSGKTSSSGASRRKSFCPLAFR